MRNALSDKQQIVLNVLVICSASLSVIGSSTLVFKILRDRAQNGSTTRYDRFVLGLSTTDILASITFAIGQFLIPSETGTAWAVGSPSTCRISGFFYPFSAVWNFWNTGILSYYFLLTVISQVRRRNDVRKCEPFTNLRGLLFPFTAAVLVIHGLYR